MRGGKLYEPKVKIRRIVAVYRRGGGWGGAGTPRGGGFHMSHRDDPVRGPNGLCQYLYPPLVDLLLESTQAIYPCWDPCYRFPAQWILQNPIVIQLVRSTKTEGLVVTIQSLVCLFLLLFGQHSKYNWETCWCLSCLMLWRAVVAWPSYINIIYM